MEILQALLQQKLVDLKQLPLHRPLVNKLVLAVLAQRQVMLNPEEVTGQPYHLGD